MNSADVIGYIQIVVGIVGIILTLTNFQNLVPEVGHFANGRGAPPELDNLSGFIRVSIVLTILLLMLFMITFGFSVVLSQAFAVLGARFPQLSSVMTIISLLSLSITLALAAFRNSYWISGVVGALGSGLGAIVAAVNDDLGTYWLVTSIFIVLFLITGAITVIARAGALAD